jgi:PAS domain S-box-containing protein
MSERLRVLIVEDNPADVALTREALPDAGAAGFLLESAPRLSVALARLEAEGIDLVLLDLGLPDSQGLDTFRRLRDAAPKVPVIVLTGNVDQAVGLAAVSEGAQDYLVKGEVTGESVARSIRHAIERRRAEERLRKSEERFRTLYENATIGLYRTAPDGAIILANPTLVKMLGFSSSDELLTRNLEADGFEPSYPRSQFLERIEQEGTVNGLEAAWTRRDGTTLVVRESARAIRDPDGKTVFYDGTVEDITERKQAEDALARGEAKYRDLVENLNDVIYAVDLNGTITYASAPALEVMGYSPEDLIGRSFREIIHPDDLPGLDRRFGEILQGSIRPWEFRYRTKDGETRWAHTSSRPVFEDGRPVGISGLLSDITEHKRDEELIRASQGRLEEAQRMAHLGSWEMDLITGQTTWSRELCRLFEIPPETIRAGRSQLRAAIDERIHPDDRARYTQAVARIVDQKTPYDIDYRIQLPDGSQRHIHAEGAASSDPAGNLVRLAGTAMDITERKQAELERERLLRREIALNHVTLALGQLTALPAILRALGGEVRTLLDADGFFVSRYDKDAGLITALFAIDAGTERDVSTFPAVPLAPEGKGMQSHVLRTLKPLNVPDWLEWERRMQTVHHIAADGTFTPPPPANERENCTKSALLVPMMFQGEPIGVLQVQSNRLHAYSDEDMDLLAGLANVAAISIENALLITEVEHAARGLRLSLEGTLHAVSAAAETRDPYTAGHQRRATDLAIAIARVLGCSDDECNALRIAGTVHDIGKLGIPAEILSKPGTLAPIELALIREHPQTAYAILADVPFPGPVAKIVLQHHERLDGSGYPHALMGDQILREARILAVADVVEAMASHRPYREARGIDAALGEIEQNAGRLYDSEAVKACLHLFRDKGYALPA